MKTIQEKIAHSTGIIRKAIEEYPRIAVATSFGKDSMVVLHLALQVKPDIRCFSVLTPFKPRATFEFKDRMVKEWALNLEEFISDERVPADLMETDPDECCRLLKVEPTRRALEGLDAWITGLRRTEGRTRADYQEVEPAEVSYFNVDGREVKADVTKVNPILDWTETDIWKYTALYKIPVHDWYYQGYRSLGCEPCTSKVDDSDDERMGRWRGTSKCGGECGIHTMNKK